jgi:hypothetical protein
MRLPNFCGGSCPEFSVNVNAERTRNLYPHLVGGGLPKSNPVLYRIPGLQLFAQLTGDTTDAFEINGRLVAATDHFYEIDSAGTATDYGAIATDANPATLSSNGDGGDQVMLTAGGEGYIFNLSTNTFTIISDPDFPSGSAKMADFIDGYFAVLNGDDGTFQLCALENGAAWDALDIGQPSQNADRVSALVCHDRQIWLFGRTTTSTWYNSGNADFPFQPTSNILPVGIVAPFTAKRLDNTIVWLGRSEQGAGVCYRATQGSPQRISTHALEAIWSTYDTMEDAIAYTELWNGHAFYHLYFPAAIDAPENDNAVTWTYDASTNLWHERALWNEDTGVWSPYVGRSHVYAFEKHLIGDRRTGALYAQRADLYDLTLVTV